MNKSKNPANPLEYSLITPKNNDTSSRFSEYIVSNNPHLKMSLTNRIFGTALPNRKNTTTTLT
jgi:hypothetical protein